MPTYKITPPIGRLIAVLCRRDWTHRDIADAVLTVFHVDLDFRTVGRWIASVPSLASLKRERTKRAADAS